MYLEIINHYSKISDSEPVVKNPRFEIRNPKFKVTFIIITLIPFFILLSSCKDKNPIPEDKLIKVYVDLLIIQDTTTANTVSIDSLKSIVFKRYNITPDEYEKTIAAYNSLPQKWEKFFDKATAYVQKLKTKHGQ